LLLRRQGARPSGWTVFACVGWMSRTNVYIDGFNLYYAIRRSSYKWLDLSSLCARLLPSSSIQRIYYFTALVKPLPHDMDAPIRQATYLRALRTLAKVEIRDEGHFVQWSRWLPKFPLIYDPAKPNSPPQAVNILKTEEKGSDVNLASFLLKDSFKNYFDEAAVISNDSDLVTPIEIVIKECHKPVIVINPHRESYFSRDLLKVASRCYRQINWSAYKNSQFPPIMSDSVGTFSKPTSW